MVSRRSSTLRSTRAAGFSYAHSASSQSNQFSASGHGRDKHVFKVNLLAIAISCAFAGVSAITLLTPTSVMAAEPAGNTSGRSYAISPGKLSDVLAEFAATAGVQLVFDPQLLAGRNNRGLQGQYGIRDGFSRLLTGTGLEAYEQTGGSYGVREAAKDGSGAGVLPAVTVSAQAERDITSEGTGSYAARGASIMKGAESLKEIPQSVSVITTQRMEDQNLTSVQQAMEQATGIYINPFRSVYAGNGNSADYYSRGFAVENYMVDGVVSDSADPNISGNVGLEGSSAIYDRVEILRGAAGLLVGQGNAGGTVNLVRKRPTRDFRQSYTLSAGSWSNHRGEADISGSLNESGSVRGRVVAAYQDRDRFWNDTNSKSPLLYGILEADIAPATQVALGIRYEKYRETSPKQNSFFDSTTFTPDRRRNYSPTWGYNQTEDKEVFLSLDHQFNDRWKLTIAGSHWERKYEGVLPIVFTQRSNLQVKKTEQKTDRLDVNLVGAFDALGREHTFTLGFNASKMGRDNRYLWSSNITSVSLVNNWAWSYDEAMQNLVSSTFSENPDRTESKSYGLLGKLNFKLTDDLTAIVGGRMSWYQYDYWNSSGVHQPTSGGRVNHKFTPYAGLVYALTPQWSAYVSYADIFRPQWGYYTRGGSLIDHEMGKSYELGIKGELLNGRLNTAFAIYQANRENTAMLESEPYNLNCSGNPAGGACYTAVGKSRTRGFDAEVNGELLPGWQMGAGYTYSHQEILKSASTVGYAMSNTPRHLFKLFSSYQLDDQWTLGGGVQVQSEEAPTYSASVGKLQSGYSVWNAFARYRINKNLEASLNVKNLFDKTYWANGAAYYKSLYGEPRSFMLTLRARY